MKNISTTSFKKYCAFVAVLSFYLFAMLFNGATANAQISNIKFSSEPATYSELSGGTSLIAGGNVAVGAATLKSAVTPIGFTFKYQGVDYTQFSAAATGMLQFGATQVGVFDNTSILTPSVPFVCAAWDNYTVGTAASGGGVTYQLSGSAPNQVLTVQWKVTKTANTAAGYNFQVKLYEGTNKIELLIGSGPVAAITSATGLNNSANEHMWVYTSNETLFTSMNLMNTAWPTAGTLYTFTPKTATATGAVVATTPNFWVKADQPVLFNRTFLNVPAANRTASSVYTNLATYNAAQSVLSANGWLPSQATWQADPPVDFITLDLGSVRTIDGIGTMGRNSPVQTPSSLTVKVSSDNVNWTNLGLFLRNENNVLLQYSDFDAPVTTRYVRVYPTDYVSAKAMRLDVYTKTANTTPPANNTAMDFWEDLSGNDWDAMSGSTIGRPGYFTNQFNFNPAVNFPATTTILNNPDYNYRSRFVVRALTSTSIPELIETHSATPLGHTDITGIQEMAESISYPSQQSGAQKNVITTYLGTKYGITLTNDYIAADGTTKVYDLTANAGYVSNIFGIGRADSQGLHQRQSKSVNNAALVTIGNNNIIDNTNGNSASAGNNIGADNSYLLIGDNGGALSWTAGACTPTGTEGILQRNWKVQETGTIGSVKVQFDTQATSGSTAWLPLGNDPTQKVYLVISSDAVFTDAGDTRVLMTLDATSNTYSANVDLSTGQYFTVVAGIASPGGVISGLQQWLRADNAALGLSNGATMSNWPESYLGRTMNKNSGSPKYQENIINFNPVVYFDGASSFAKSLKNAIYAFSGSFTSGEAFGMIKPIQDALAHSFPWDYGSGSRGVHYPFSSGIIYDGFGTTDRLGFNAATAAISEAKVGLTTLTNPYKPYEWTLYNHFSETNNWGINANSLPFARSTSNATGFTLVTEGVSIGEDGTNYFKGYLPEVFVYNRVLSVTERHQVNTYMAIKYGQTLAHNYRGPDGTILFNETTDATYFKNVIGLARSDCQGLHQRQSKSINTTGALTIGNNNTIGTKNAASIGNDFTTNDSYLLIGDNNGDLKLNYTTTINKYFFNRVWKLNETGTVGSVKISIPSYTNTAAVTLPNYYSSFFPNNKVYLAMDDDGNFQNGGTTYVEAVAVGSGATATYEVNVDLTNAKPFLAFAVDKDMTDSDGDSVVNADDIDDDNDGILDLSEVGTCTYPDKLLSDLTYTGNALVTTSGTTINVISNANGNWRSSYSDQTLKLPIHLEYTTTSNVAYTSAMIGLLPVGNTQNVTNWNDGAYKVYHVGTNIQLYKPQGVTTPVTTFYLTRPYTAAQKMEIDISATGMVTIKQAGVIIKKFKGRVADYKLAFSAAYNINRVFSDVHLTSWSLNGVCVDIDTDGDGVPNHFDLDSDNDGCKDHIEGGAATSTATTIPYGNVGTNGLADALENPADSGYIIYEDIYDTYAINDTIEACDDHDNDGILDYIDIDDDNDGVLDTEEQANCTVPNVVLDDLTWTGNTTVSAFETTVSGISTAGAANTGSWTSSYSNEELELPIHLEFTTATNNIEGMIGLIPATAAQPANVWDDVNSYKYYFGTASNYYGKFPSSTWNISSTGYTATQKFELDINEQGVLTATVNGVMMHRIQAPVAPYKFVVSGKTAEKQYDNVVLVAKSPNTICEDIDTDGDGIPNRLDLDSDEDGCNDAVEAGVGNASTTVPLTGAVGANGLVDTKETAVDNGRINYSSTYDFYGVSETENVCLDSDGDSIGNLTDIDDDNDGVLDAIEMGCSVPLFVNKTSENTTTSKKLTGTILKETGTVDYEIAMSGAGVTNPGVYDGGNGIHFRVDGVTNALYMNLKLTATAAENSSTTSPPKVKTIDFGPSVPLNTSAGTTINQKSNITLTWPGAYGVVYDPNNQLSSHNTGDIIKSGDLLVQNIDITAAQIAAGQTWKIKMYMHTTADVYDINASVFGDAALGAEAYGFNTQVCSPADTDADGLPNHLDTDADGDGCYDAYESSSVNSSTQATVAGPYGNNGFASSLETNDNFDAGMTTAFSNTISYNQAISSAVNSCSDTDGDGIKDSEDIDDDNDGIVDADEMSCGVAYFTMPTLTTGATANLQNLTGTASLGNAGIDYELNLVGVNTVFTNATTNTQFDNSKDGIHYAFTDNDNVYSQTYKLSPSAPTLIKKVRFGVNVPTNQITTTQVNDAQSIVLTWSPDIKAVVYDPNDQLSTHATGDVITSGTTITTRANYTIAASTWKIEFLANGLAREFYLQTTHKTTSSTNVGVEGYGLSADICFVNDTDGDGISDHLDTDSDDDGCGDAYESGATSTPGGATQTVAGPYGTNGLANSLETNDTQDASTTYASTAYMAYSPVSACADTDNDGIPDRDDIDDDNDGILDATEYGCGVGTFVKSYVITSGLGMGYGGSFNNGNSKGTGTMSFTDLSSVVTVSDVTDAANYKVNDANTAYKFKASIAPTNGIISQLVFGPNLPGNTANAAVVNGQQSITLSWNFPVGGIVYDPDNQLSSHTDGQGINPGDIVTTSANYAVSVSTWKVVIPFNYINKQVDFTAQFVGVANLGDESFGISTNICNKVTDVDGD